MSYKNLCAGCRNDTKEGGCWLLKTAQPVQRTLVGYNQNPPYTWHPQTVYNCHEPSGQVWIKQDDIRIAK